MPATFACDPPRIINKSGNSFLNLSDNFVEAGKAYVVAEIATDFGFFFLIMSIISS